MSTAARGHLPLLRVVRGSVLAQNLIALYAVHALNYLIPLATIPFLTRTLGPQGWGGVAFVQSLGAMVILVVEYGFTLSAGRDVSLRRDDHAWLAHKFSAVTAAKAVLLAVTLAAALCGARFVPYLSAHPQMFHAGMVGAAAQGMNPLWLFQGLERMRLTSSIDVAFKSLGVVAIFALIRTPAQAPMVLVIYASAALGSTACINGIAIRELGIRPATGGDVLAELRKGFSLFLFQASVALFTSANGFILGLLAPVRTVGIYVGAERISKSVLGLLGPVNQAVYPRINRILDQSRQAAVRLVRRGFLAVLGITSALALGLMIAAPVAVRLLLGPQFHESIATLRILALLVPVIGMSNVIGVQWMLPLRRDRAFSAIVMAAGAANLLLAFLLAPLHAANGMAVAVLSAEVLVTAGCFAYLCAIRSNPLWTRFGSHLLVDLDREAKTSG